ncbi:MAG: GntR family transcriptional regulator [Chloroflexota bacterium]|nr:GntR family transcriptional regulator [Chloroflexota bacterium]
MNTNITYQPLNYLDLTEQTYGVLKEKILRGELKPGEQISVPTTALALGVSRTPVNDALKRLANDGLVEIVPRQGTFVTQLTSRDVVEIFDMRLMIELYAAEAVFQRGVVEQLLQAMQPCLTAMEQAIAGNDFRDHETFSINDQDFHTLLVKSTRNNRLFRTYTQLHANTHGARVHYITSGDARETQNEHRAIVAGFQNGSVAQVKSALHTHISRVQHKILDVLEERGGKL